MTATLDPPARAPAPRPTPVEALDRLPDPEALLDDLGDRLDPAAYDLDAVDPDLLTDEEVFCLAYAAEVEWGTEGTFASLDITDDPVVKRFLAVWLDQEVVHAELLGRIVARTGARAEPRHRTLRQRFAARRGRWLNLLLRRVFGDDFFALHMTWGAVNELSTLRFYGVLRRRAADPVVRQVLRDVMAQEAAHYAFYRAVAMRRLAASERARRLVRFALTKVWRPVGSGLRRSDDVRRISQVLLDEPRVVRQMDAQIDRLPGMGGLDLFRTQLAR